MRATIKLFSLFLFVSIPAQAAELSYGELAKKTISSSWKKVDEELDAIRPGILPHQVKTARKQVAALKESLDLFAYSYPSEPEDLWVEIRKNLDEGYETLGNFKDLYDIQDVEKPEDAEYDDKEVLKEGKKVLAWSKDWGAKKAKYSEYAFSPSKTDIFERKKKQLSRFYWGATDLVPSARLTGLQNLAKLSAALRDAAIDDWKSVRKIKNPADDSSNEETFHDFRKRVRSLARILRNFSSIYSGTEKHLAELEELADRYGSIHDKIVAYEKASSDGKKKRAEKLYDQVHDEWKEFLQEQEDRGIKDLLQSIKVD